MATKSPFIKDKRYDRFKNIATVAAFTLTIAIIALLPLAPGVMAELAAEDNVVESIQAVLLFLSSLSFFFLAKKYRQNDQPANLAVALLMAGALFVMAGEEISWGQRLLGLEAPALFAEHNEQNETNLHNFATNITNLAIHLGAFALFVIIPLLRKHIIQVLEKLKIGRFSQFLTPTWMIAPFALFTGFVIRTNSSTTIVATVYLTLLALLYLLFTLVAAKSQKRSIAIVALSLVLTLTTFVSISSLNYPAMGFGDGFYLISEYKELLIALGIFCYAVSLHFENFTIKGKATTQQQ